MSHVTRPLARATLGALVGALVLILATQPAAIHGNAEFELDADATDGVDAREDWATHFPEDTAPGGTAFATFFSAEPASDDQSYFTTGGSKDVNDVPLWRHDPDAGSTDKNEITNGYAAMYLQGSDRLILFGADRFAQNGNSAIGFWFFQNPISPDPVGPNGSGTFTGQHTDGDILVLSDFVNGGSTADLQTYEWSAGALNLLDESAACDAAHGLAEACARVNDVDIASPWPYQPKSGSAGIIPATGFFEAGINLDFFFGAEEVPCFTQFLTTTRTSQSTTSQFKDFVLGDFETCKLRISITPQDADNDVGTTHDFMVLVEIDRGFGWEPAEGANVTAVIDSGPGSFVGDNTCQTGADGTCTVTITSDTAGTTTVSASAGFKTGSTTLEAATDEANEGEGGTGPATKSWIKLASTTTTTPTSASIVLGGSVADQVNVSGALGTPTGTVSFFVCAPGELDANGLCSTGGTFLSTEDLVDGAATSASVTPAHAGTWCFRGEYSGDDTYDPSTDASVGECFEVTPGPSSTTTTPTSDKIELGETIADRVVVSGLGDEFPRPTGSVDFFLCDPSALDANGLCSAGGTFLSTEELVDGTATSDPVTIPKDSTLTGTWCFRGEYSGDANYQPSTDFAANECFVVVGPLSNLTKAVRVLPDGTFGPGASAWPGDALEYLLTYANEGEGAATDVALTEEVPPHSSFVACSNGCTVSGDGSPGTLLTWSLGTVDPDESVLVTFEVVLDAEFPSGETPISNVASFDTAEEPPGDSNEVIVVVTASAELFIEKAANRTGVMPGGAITYTLAFGNTGNATATEATVTETLPPGTTFDSCSDGCTVSGSTVTWDVAPLAPGETGSVTLSVVFDGLEACEVCNVATIGSPQDPESPRESNEVCIRIGANPAGANTSGNATGLQVSDTVLALTIVRSEAGSSQSGIGENSDFDRVEHIDVTGDGSLAVVDLFTTRTTNVVSGDSLDASTTSIAEAAGVDLLDGAITASTVRAVATATASGTTATTSSAGTLVEGLRVLGEPVAALSPGERLELPAAVFGEGSYLAVEETVTTVERPDGLVGGTYAATTTVRGLLAHVTGIPLVMEALDIVVSEAIARADFPQTPLCEDESAQAVAGHATILEVGPLSVGRVELASTGGDEERNVTEVDATDVLFSGAETRTTGFITPDASEAESTAHAEDLCILPEIGPGGTCVLAATTVRSEARANANASGAEASGDSFLEGLFIDGVDQCAELGIDLCRPMPNTVLFDVPGTLFVVLNEQVPDPASPDGAGLTVRALRAVLLDGAEIIVAETHAAASFTVPAGAGELAEEGGFLEGFVPEPGRGLITPARGRSAPS